MADKKEALFPAGAKISGLDTELIEGVFMILQPSMPIEVG